MKVKLISQVVYVGNTLHYQAQQSWKDETGSNPVLTTNIN
jgi:hypothetical protein